MRVVHISGLFVLVLSVTALAGEPPASSGARAPSASSATSSPSSKAPLGEPVSADALDTQRGGDDTVHNIAHITGEVTDNTARNVVTGANTIADGSFANSSGISTVVQNTGANVLIQNATIVNVQFVDP